MRATDSLRRIYRLRLEQFGRRIPRIEEYLSLPGERILSEDDRRNEPTFFAEIAENDGAVLRECLKVLFEELRSVSYRDATTIIDAVSFVQWVIADVMWRYKHKLAEELEIFTRDFDRLDIEAERFRLYSAVMNGEWQM